ncbi:MAG: hypothetical protein U0941_02575 [Planctomycetaceae bacterium]
MNQTSVLFLMVGLVTCLAGNLAALKPVHAQQQPESTEKIDFERARELFRKRQNGEKLTADEEAYLRRAQAARQASNTTSKPNETAPPGEKIDFDRARQLFQKRQNGGKLTEDEEAYLRKAMAARQGGTGAAPSPREKTGLIPLTEMNANDRYQGEDGGLYGGGRNSPPESHETAAMAELSRIRPLDTNGKPADDGRIVFVSISMSNATQEFSRFKQLADADPAKSDKLTIVDCAQGGQAMAEWAPADAQPWSVAEQTLARANVSPKQVQVAWIKLANKGPSGALTVHGKKLEQDTQAVIQNAKARFPNLRIAYLSSRIYAGYATNALNPEPYAYESAFVARWLIQDQIRGNAALKYVNEGGTAKAPLLLWGPYLWADGTSPRKSDQLVYTRDDLAGDGTHPSDAGRTKVARLMLDFYKTDRFAKSWFLGTAAER